MPKIKVNDISMYYEIYGTGEPLVLISGFSADHIQWGLILEHLTPHYQVIVLDNRGAGKTDVPEGPYNIEQMAQDIADLCSQLGITKAHFVGNSMGGYLAQMLAYRHASIVKSVVISNSGLGTPTCFHTFLEAQLDLIKAKAPLAAILKASCAWVFSPLFLSQPYQLEGLIQLGLNNPNPFTVEGFEGQYAALSTFNSQEWIQEIKVPTLVISGEQDLVLPPYLAETIHAQISQSSYYCFKNCGHLPHIEYPTQFATVIQQFFHNL
jgi:pimeloyl-ACP methyl ester carboxylesterase